MKFRTKVCSTSDHDFTQWYSTWWRDRCTLLQENISACADALDKVSHRGALHKASTSGIVGPLHRWPTSYLCDCTLRIVIGRQQSSSFSIRGWCIPLGVTWAQLFFSCYVNDCTDHVGDRAQLVTYADDAALYTCLMPAHAADQSHELQVVVDAVSAWGRYWYITLEPTKSQAPSTTTALPLHCNPSNVVKCKCRRRQT